VTTPEPTVSPAPRRSPARRIAAAVALGVLIFAVLSITLFSLMTSLLIGTACCVVVVAAGSVWDLAEALLDAVATVIFGIFAVIAAIFAAIFGLFGF
jgi:hypothetical protein